MSGFRWPIDEHFNWALDYFDAIAIGNDAPALHIVEEDGREIIRSFAQLSAASNRVAHFLRRLGARKGDCLMLMLGNEVPLWETLLAAIKLGVVVTPATTLLTTADLQDRVERGRLTDRPIGLTHGYADDDAKTSAVMRDGDGYLTFVGRADDVFKASDYRLSPFELESVLIECPAVAEAAVVPSPDPVRNAVPKAFVTLADGVTPCRNVAAEILRHCRDRLAPYQRIRRIEFGPLPKTISGKIRRVELRQTEAERRARGDRASHEYFEEDL